MSVAAALAEATHHSFPKGGWSEAYKAPRGPKTVSAKVEPELFELFDEEPAGARPDRLAGVRPQERVQRHTVEHIVDSAPVVPSLDAPVPLMAEQLVDVLSLVEEYEKEMDRIEDLILVGSPVSVADREAWRRWVNNASSSGSKRKKKKRRKRKLPKAGARPVLGQGGCRARCCATTGFGEPVVCQRHRPWTSWRRFRLCASSWGRSWCANATDHGGFRRATDHGGNHGGDSAGDKVVDMLVIVQRQVLGETEQKTEEVPQFRSHGVVQFLDKVVDTPAGVQRQVLGSDCAENRGVSAVAALGRVCPGQPGRFFEPSMMKSSSSSRAPWGWR